MASEVLATKVVTRINDKMVGCATSATFVTEREMVPVTCAATAGFSKQVPGNESWNGSLNAVMRLFDEDEEAENVTIREIYTALREGALIDIEYELGGPTGEKFTSKAYLSNVTITIPEGSGAVNWSANLIGAEPLLLAA